MKRVAVIVSLLAAFVLSAGCAGTSARTQELMQRDYRAMSDQEILTYYYQINDQIAREERAARSTSVGLGVGTGPVSVGVSQGVSRGRVAEDLRERQSQVRTELTQRGLRP